MIAIEVPTFGGSEVIRVVEHGRDLVAVAVVLDSVGGEVLRASLGVARPFGRMLVVGASSGEPRRIDPIELVHRSVAVLGVQLRHLLEHRELVEERSPPALLGQWAVISS
jgi:NADPH:quinone reductase